MKQVFDIPGRLPTWDDQDPEWEYIAQLSIDEAIKGLEPMKAPVGMKITWAESDAKRKRWPDSHTWYIIVDRLVKAGVFPAAPFRKIPDVENIYRFSANHPHVFVELYEVRS